MISVPDAALRSYKRIIDQGFALPFGEGMRLEREISGAANRGVAPQEIEKARLQVRERGQAQTRRDGC